MNIRRKSATHSHLKIDSIHSIESSVCSCDYGRTFTSFTCRIIGRFHRTILRCKRSCLRKYTHTHVLTICYCMELSSRTICLLVFNNSPNVEISNQIERKSLFFTVHLRSLHTAHTLTLTHTSELLAMNCTHSWYFSTHSTYQAGPMYNFHEPMIGQTIRWEIKAVHLRL